MKDLEQCYKCVQITNKKNKHLSVIVRIVDKCAACEMGKGYIMYKECIPYTDFLIQRPISIWLQLHLNTLLPKVILTWVLWILHGSLWKSVPNPSSSPWILSCNNLANPLLPYPNIASSNTPALFPPCLPQDKVINPMYFLSWLCHE